MKGFVAIIVQGSKGVRGAGVVPYASFSEWKGSEISGGPSLWKSIDHHTIG